MGSPVYEDTPRNRRTLPEDDPAWYRGPAGGGGVVVGSSGSSARSNMSADGYNPERNPGAGSYDPTGAILTGIIGYIGQREANRTNREIADQNREFQERMSRTAHQRQVADLRRAGLNPILSANSGASVPTGSTAHMENALGPAVSSAVEALRLQKEMRAVDSQAKLNESTAVAQQAAANYSNTSARESAVRTEIAEKTAPGTISQSQLQKKQADWDQKALQYDNINRRLQQGLGTLNNAKDLVNPLIRGGDRLRGNEMIINKKTGEILREGR